VSTPKHALPQAPSKPAYLRAIHTVSDAHPRLGERVPARWGVEACIYPSAPRDLRVVILVCAYQPKADALHYMLRRRYSDARCPAVNGLGLGSSEVDARHVLHDAPNGIVERLPVEILKLLEDGVGMSHFHPRFLIRFSDSMASYILRYLPALNPLTAATRMARPISTASSLLPDGCRLVRFWEGYSLAMLLPRIKTPADRVTTPKRRGKTEGFLRGSLGNNSRRRTASA